MNEYLHNLAIEILKLQPEQSKVKFAKLIYFVHKELVRNELVDTKDLSFIRMPLGPVPEGFMDLQNLKDVQVSVVSTALLYNSQVYRYVGSNETSLSKPIKSIVESTLNKLSRMSTADLVDLSHNEDSWKKFNNGDKYFINDKDLDTSIPSTISRPQAEIKLQEKLIDGMMSDIVGSSTSLEYPQDES